MNTKTNSPAHEVGSSALFLPLRERLDALSDNAKEWLEKTCERFADGAGYDIHMDEIKECLAAKLITKSGRWIDVDSDVMELVYSESYFLRQNDQGHAAARGGLNELEGLSPSPSPPCSCSLNYQKTPI